MLSATGGEGVDVVVNSLAGPALARSLAILRPGGRFLELGKRDRLEGGQLRLTALEDSRTFALIDLDSLAEKRPDFCGRLLRDALAAFEGRGDAPIAKQVYTAGQLGEALHHMARAHHIGKVVIRLDAARHQSGRPSAHRRAAARRRHIRRHRRPRRDCPGHQSLARGPRRAASRAPGPSSAVARSARSRRRHGTCWSPDRHRAARRRGCDGGRSAFERWAADLPPVRGILHAAGLLDDGILLQQSAARFESVMAPKVAGAWNLHQASRDLPLDLFVLFSSAASMLGSAGQANYAAANQFLDALAAHRRANGLVAVSVNWGPWSEVGLATRPDRGRRLEAEGMKSLTPVEGIAALEQVLLGARSVIGVMRVDWPALRAAQPLVITQPFFSRVSAGEPDRTATSTIRAQVLAASADDRVGLLAERLREHAASVLRLPASKIDLEQPLLTMGIDSLMAIELKSRVEREIGVAIPLLQLVKGPSLVELAHVLLAAMTGDASSPPPPRVHAGGRDRQVAAAVALVREREWARVNADGGAAAGTRLSAATKVAYGVGALGDSIKTFSFTAFMLFYYTTVLELSGTLLGFGMAVGLVWDAVVDPFIGHASDRSKSRFGRRHLFMLLGTMVTAAGFVAVFNPPSGLSMAALFAWLMVTSLVVRSANSLFLVPYSALGSELAADYHERTSLAGYRAGAVLVGTLAAAAMAFLVFLPGGADGGVDGKFVRANYESMGVAFGLMILATGLVATFGTLHARSRLGAPAAETDAGSLRRNVRAALGLRSFRVLLAATALSLTATAVNAALLLHYLTYHAKVQSSQPIGLVFGGFYLGALAGVAVWVRVSRRIERHHVYAATVIVSAVFTSCGYWLIGEGRPLGTRQRRRHRRSDHACRVLQHCQRRGGTVDDGRHHHARRADGRTAPRRHLLRHLLVRPTTGERRRRPDRRRPGRSVCRPGARPGRAVGGDGRAHRDGLEPAAGTAPGCVGARDPALQPGAGAFVHRARGGGGRRRAGFRSVAMKDAHLVYDHRRGPHRGPRRRERKGRA